MFYKKDVAILLAAITVAGCAKPTPQPSRPAAATRGIVPHYFRSSMNDGKVESLDAIANELAGIRALLNERLSKPPATAEKQ